jgi:serine/threonine-protein kinase
VREIFDRAFELDVGSREAVVRELAGEDDTLVEEILALLDAHERARAFEQPAASLVDAETEEIEEDHSGRRIGNYRLIRKVGEGGMGAVYEAERADEQYEQRVAVKLIKRGMDSDAIVRRFRRERQILASLDHPNISRLVDGGITERGEPYFVMEFVEGRPIHEFANEHQLDTHARVELFRGVCAAVAYAHRNLVVHRDLKPSNIMVTPDGTVKLLDFGVARLLRDPESDAGQTLTQAGFRVLTPEYASPEQLRGERVSTTSDVYSLGVVLYELLTGQTPFRLNDSPVAMAKALELEPTRPSEAITVGKRGALADRARLRRLLAGELDNIVLMALRKEPERRYSSVDQLGEDLRRYLEGLPVFAQRDTAGYRLRKLVQRHRAASAGAAIVVLVLIGGIITTSWQARRASAEARRAQTERAKAERISTFLQDMLGSADPRASGRDVTVAELLGTAGERARTELAADPEVLAAVEASIGTSYLGLGLYDEALPLLEDAVRLRRTLPDAGADLARSLGNLAILYRSRGELDKAEPVAREALELQRNQSPVDTVQLATLVDGLGQLMNSAGRYDEAEQLHREALALRRGVYGDVHEEIALSLNNLGVVLGQKGDWPAAEPLHLETLEITRKVHGAEHPDVAAAMSTLAFVLAEQKKYDAADTLYRQALDMRTRLLGPEHPDVAWNTYYYATLLQDKGDYASSIRYAQQVLALRGRTLPESHAMIGSALQTAGRSYVLWGRPADGEPFLRESLDVRRRFLPTGHWLIASAESVLGECLVARREFRAAEPLLLNAYERLAEALGNDHERARETAQRLVSLYLATNRAADAARWRALTGRAGS